MSFKGSSGSRALRALSTNSLTGKGPLSFERVTSSQAGMHYFLKFCSTDDLSSESLLFWMEARSYTQLSAGIHRELAARKIFAKFFAPDAPMLLALSTGLVAEMAAELRGNAGPSRDVFEEAHADVSYTLRYDVFPRFLSSSHYFKLVNLTLEERLRIDIEKFDLYRLLGAGGFGMVLLVRRKTNGNYFACKVIDKRIVISQKQFHAVFREKETLASLDHPFICGLRCSFQTEHHLCLVLDFVEGGNMYSDLLDGPYQLPRAVFYAAQVCLALHYIHSHGILYRDLKPDNVLLDLHGYLKLADMGAARGIASDGFIAAHNVASLSAAKTARLREENTRQRRMTITGTHGYRAPEVYERDYGKAADWWNVGLLIVEMLCRENPLRGENRRESEHLTKTKEVEIPEHFTPATADIVRRLLQKDPAMRLGCRGAHGDDSFAEIQDHPFFEDPVIHWGELLELRHPVPFDMARTNVRGTPKAPQRLLTSQTNQIDYFSQTVSAPPRTSFPPPNATCPHTHLNSTWS